MRTTNLLILRGYTGGAPKAFGNGRIAKVSVATNRSWIDKTTGDRVEKTDWVTVTILNEQDAKFALANVRKGSPIYAECRVAESSYQKDGRTIYGVDIVAEVLTCWRRRRLRPRSMSRNSIHASGVERDRLGLASPASCPPRSISVQASTGREWLGASA
jgi:single-strand DNA-binding protein